MSAWKAGKVLWFDQMVGEGLIIDDFGHTYYVHESAIVGSNLKKETGLKLKDNSKVKFTIYENGFLSQIDKIREM